MELNSHYLNNTLAADNLGTLYMKKVLDLPKDSSTYDAMYFIVLVRYWDALVV